MPSRSTILILSLWTLTILGAIGSAPSPLNSDFPQEMTVASIVTILLMPPLFFGVMSFWMRHSPFYSATFARFVDARLGDNAFSKFLVRLKPLLMLAAAAAIQGTLGLWHAKNSGQSSGAYAVYGFFISSGIGFTLAHAILYYRRATGVYFSPSGASFSPARSEPLPLRDALRTYWWTLIGLAAFPTLLFVLGEFFHVPFEYFAIPFFAVGLLAGWPFFSGRAPFTFCLVLCGVWLVAGIVAILILGLVRAVVGGG